MAFVTLSLLKSHVRADDFDTDDELLEHYAEVATEKVLTDTNRSASDYEDEDPPLALQQAVLLLAGHYYNQREAVSSGSMSSVPEGYSALIRPWRILVEEE